VLPGTDYPSSNEALLLSCQLLKLLSSSFSYFFTEFCISAKHLLRAGFLLGFFEHEGVPPKRRLNFNGLHNVISQNLLLFITTALTTLNLKFHSLLEFTFLTAVVTICTTYFNKLNSALYPQTVYVCCVWFSQKTETVFRKSINRLGS
jgi:hypothetical protein